MDAARASRTEQTSAGQSKTRKPGKASLSFLDERSNESLVEDAHSKFIAWRSRCHTDGRRMPTSNPVSICGRSHVHTWWLSPHTTLCLRSKSITDFSYIDSRIKVILSKHQLTLYCSCRHFLPHVYTSALTACLFGQVILDRRLGIADLSLH